MPTSVALSGDAILNRRVSTCEHDRFRSMIAPLQEADVSFTHLETLLFDFDDPGVYPAAEAGGTWMHSDPEIASEFAWAGFDLVSHASNHAMDYAYGGLESTWRALDRVGIRHAGTGPNLAEARTPTYFDAGEARVGLVSMTTSFTPWARAGEARRDMQGRPGVNPLGYRYVANEADFERIVETFRDFRYWIRATDDDQVTVNPTGLHNAFTHLAKRDVDRVERELLEADVEGNLRAIADADRQANLAIAHIHTHDWDPEAGFERPPSYLQEFARDCLEHGADIVLCQGTHTPLRGIELHADGVIFYDPGDFFMMSDSVQRLPADFYTTYAEHLDAHPHDALPGEGLAARGLTNQFEGGDDEDSVMKLTQQYPAGGYFSGEVIGNVVPVCEFDDADTLTRITLHPGELADEPEHLEGMPLAVDGQRAREILEHLDDLSGAFGVDVAVEDDRGIIEA